jgi:hypothetical protein
LPDRRGPNIAEPNSSRLASILVSMNSRLSIVRLSRARLLSLGAACLICLTALSALAGVTFSSTNVPATGLFALEQATIHAFDLYVANAETRNSKTLKQGNFLWIDDLRPTDREQAYARLRAGETEMRRVTPGEAGANVSVPGGMIHDWQGIIFIPDAKIDDVLRVLQDYDHHSSIYAPDVEKSKLESRDGDHFKAFLRFRRHKVITVVLDTEHDITYFHDSATRAHSRSSATRIAEVDNPGTPKEKEKTPGDDNGFMWRMETWWRLEERDGGVYVQNEVVSLSRDIPVGLGWMIEPFVTSIPKESLAFTMEATRRSVVPRKNATASLR